MAESLAEKLGRIASERQQALRPASPRISEPPASQPSTEETKDEQRRARTHRLVQIGALSDQYLNSVDLAPEQVQVLLAEIVSVPDVRAIINKSRQG